MALKREKHFVWKNGEFVVNTSTTAYVGGHPLTIGANGVARVVGTSTVTDPAQVIGVSLNRSGASGTSGTDLNNTKAAFYTIPVLLTMYSGDDDGGVYPYDSALTYVTGRGIGISGGMWYPANAYADTDDWVYGVVMSSVSSGGVTTELQVLFINQGYYEPDDQSGDQ